MATTLTKGVGAAREVTGNDSTYIYAPIGNGYASNIGEGDPVRISAGVVNLATNTAAVAGIFRGVEYIDSVTKKLVITNKWTAATSAAGGVIYNGTNLALAKIEPVSGKRFAMRTIAGVSLASSVLGSYYAVSAIGSVDAYGRSTCVIDSSAAASVGVGMVQVVGLYREGSFNQWGDAPTAVEVVFPTKDLV